MQENKPTSRQLLMSWQLIWKAYLQGNNGALREAISTHVAHFATSEQAVVRARVERLIAERTTTAATVRAFVQRGQATLGHA